MAKGMDTSRVRAMVKKRMFAFVEGGFCCGWMMLFVVVVEVRGCF